MLEMFAGSKLLAASSLRSTSTRRRRFRGVRTPATLSTVLRLCDRSSSAKFPSRRRVLRVRTEDASVLEQCGQGRLNPDARLAGVASCSARGPWHPREHPKNSQSTACPCVLCAVVFYNPCRQLVTMWTVTAELFGRSLLRRDRL